ncbi:alpha/beta superfamily hydrolase [Acidovorax sp. CF316]|uniref:alpha/beta hydrolase n=1 Tax=Acidovorax sp. CF316 TaxID=1144317 RepID=UPI00026BEEE1|nr:alpha/beta hydrolase [Acidovorax sp. CF316]EJE54770.1 alpha/beta superfamily hydrolase [Acidovorax sp. CF316]
MGWRLAVLAALVLVLGFALAAGAVGEWLSHPATRTMGPPPPDFSAHEVRIDTAPSGHVAGWFAPGQPDKGAVLLLHGVRSDRTQMLGRARFLNRAGHATLLVDLQAHGESTGERITFGAREAAGVQAALAFLRRECQGERIAVVGVSLGAAATVLSLPSPAPHAVVLESMYPTIEDAVTNRLTGVLGPAGAVLAGPLLWQLPLRAGVSTRDLRPIDHISRLGAPVLIASGAQDRHTTWAETQRLFDAAVEPKELWRVEGAAHVDLHAFAPQAYEGRILEFFARHLGTGR